MFRICLKNLNCQTWIMIVPWTFYKIGIIDSSSQINTRWYSGKSMHGSCYNLHIFTGLKCFCGTNKRTAILLLWIISSFFFFCLLLLLFERIFSTNRLKIVFFFNNGVVGIWFFPHFHFFHHGKINKRYITSVNANKEQEPKKV